MGRFQSPLQIMSAIVSMHHASYRIFCWGAACKRKGFQEQPELGCCLGWLSIEA